MRAPVGSASSWAKDAEANNAKRQAYRARYHQASDEYDPNWDLSGMVQQAQFTLNLGYAVANAPGMPTWKKGEAFGKELAADYTANRYHKPSDEYDPAWDVSGTLQDLELYYDVGLAVANESGWPKM